MTVTRSRVLMRRLSGDLSRVRHWGDVPWSFVARDFLNIGWALKAEASAHAWSGALAGGSRFIAATGAEFGNRGQRRMTVRLAWFSSKGWRRQVAGWGSLVVAILTLAPVFNTIVSDGARAAGMTAPPVKGRRANQPASVAGASQLRPHGTAQPSRSMSARRVGRRLYSRCNDAQP